MDLRIRGKKALITGADSGIGWHTAQQLLREGVTVVITDLDQTSLDQAATHLAAPDGALFAFAADIRDLASLITLHGSVADAMGDIDILVQCADVTGAQGLFHEIDDHGRTSTLETDRASFVNGSNYRVEAGSVATI